MFDFKNTQDLAHPSAVRPARETVELGHSLAGDQLPDKKECDLLCPVYLEHNTAQKGCGLLPVLVICANESDPLSIVLQRVKRRLSLLLQKKGD